MFLEFFIRTWVLRRAQEAVKRRTIPRGCNLQGFWHCPLFLKRYASHTTTKDMCPYTLLPKTWIYFFSPNFTSLYLHSTTRSSKVAISDLYLDLDLDLDLVILTKRFRTVSLKMRAILNLHFTLGPRWKSIYFQNENIAFCKKHTDTFRTVYKAVRWISLLCAGRRP